ncbi:MAG: tRNA pseudouridine(38-40) synthase TruA [Bacteroidetes bacterium]|nr:tRNA pseudouridine(38-40) synthase TruA [Bacteroidota bacterium]
MPRYFIEVAYLGTRYSGFQEQLNANSIQAEVTKSLHIYFKNEFQLTGSSRTDAGVHAYQNFFHFDTEFTITKNAIYSLNALLPSDIVVKNIFQVSDDAHCRFDAISRTYQYHIIRQKNPFYFGRAYYYPYSINMDILNEAAEVIMEFANFETFSKKHTQVNTFKCSIENSCWDLSDGLYTYQVTANRFLRGMVKGLVGTMLRLAKANSNAQELRNIFEKKDPAAADFSPPSEGLFLKTVRYKNEMFLGHLS